MNFNKWLDTFVEEKDLDTEYLFEVRGKDWDTNFIPLGSVITAAKAATDGEQRKIHSILVQIDHKNGDVMHFFEHLAGGIAL